MFTIRKIKGKLDLNFTKLGIIGILLGSFGILSKGLVIILGLVCLPKLGNSFNLGEIIC